MRKFDLLKGHCHEIFDFWFFSWISSPKPLKIPLGVFQIFSKICGDIRSSRCTTGVVDIGGKWKNLISEKCLIILFGHLTAKTKCRKFETNNPRKGISGSQSQFPHSCVCERIIYSHDGSAFSAGGNMWTDPGNICINRSQTHECGNWGWGSAIPRKGIYSINRIAVAVLRVVELTYFCLLVPFKVSSAWYCSHYLRLVAAGIVDTGGKFSTSIGNTSCTGGKICHWCR